MQPTDRSVGNGYGVPRSCCNPGCRGRIGRCQGHVRPDLADPSGSADHSTTNVQVAGVDEPDFVKNDGKYIYVITGQTLAIVDAYPAASASVISRTEIEDTPRDIFIDGNRLVLFVTGTEDTDTSSSGDSVVAASQMKVRCRTTTATPCP